LGWGQRHGGKGGGSPSYGKEVMTQFDAGRKKIQGMKCGQMGGGKGRIMGVWKVQEVGINHRVRGSL